MRILIVAMSDSIHTARWLSQITDQGWDIHLFPSIDLGEVHPDIRNVTVHHSIFAPTSSGDPSVHLRGKKFLSKKHAAIARSFYRVLNRSKRARQLSRVLQEFQPDVVHTLETQHAGYLLADAIATGAPAPQPWVHSLWGSDLFYFGRFPKHQARIREVLGRCTHLICEGRRDVQLSRDFGFSGVVLPTMQATGGFDLEKCERLASHLPPSERKLILLKGYEGWSGKALTALHALRLCKEQLNGYTLAVIHAHPNSPVVRAAKKLAHEAGMRVMLMPPATSHDSILKLYGEARLSLSISMSDGVPNSLLESMVMGAFPIQSNTSCADEWVKDGETGFIVSPTDPENISQSVRTALMSNALVDHAALLNAATIHARLNIFVNQKRTVEMYEALAKGETYA